MSTLICIDNGGTQTDAITVRNGRFFRAKALTTPHDLSKCFMDSIAALSREVYGTESLGRLLTETDLIRYSTTQGTNALVQAREKGPRLGLLVNDPDVATQALTRGARELDLYRTLIGNRVAAVSEPASDTAYRQALIGSVNALLAQGTNRIVLALDGSDRKSRELRFRRVFTETFPRHFLGATPLLLSHQLVDDDDFARRTWSGLLNSFLHPTMEHFLYNAENKLREHGMQRPLMVFRNDGNSSRVAKTVAMKTYSSGPRGGMEGARVYAHAYGVPRIVSFDVGGTTTDIGASSSDGIDEVVWGTVEGVPTSFALCNILSAAIGGSSVLGFADDRYTVGPESVGAAPGPACFARGGDRPTITDVYLLSGYFDPTTYFSGRLPIDRGLAEVAVRKHVAEPAGIPLERALLGLDARYHEVMAEAIASHADVDADTVLMAVGGAGPMSACKVAEILGVRRVIVPHAAPVFCAFGIGFSDVRYRYEEAAGDDAQAMLEALMLRARRDMFSEGFDADACELQASVIDSAGSSRLVQGALTDVGPNARIRVDIVRRLERMAMTDPHDTQSHAAPAQGARRCLQNDGTVGNVPLYALDGLQPGAVGRGPAVLEDAYMTVRVMAGWTFEVNGNRDLVLTHEH